MSNSAVVLARAILRVALENMRIDDINDLYAMTPEDAEIVNARISDVTRARAALAAALDAERKG